MFVNSLACEKTMKFVLYETFLTRFKKFRGTTEEEKIIPFLQQHLCINHKTTTQDNITETCDFQIRYDIMREKCIIIVWHDNIDREMSNSSMI